MRLTIGSPSPVMTHASGRLRLDRLDEVDSGNRPLIPSPRRSGPTEAEPQRLSKWRRRSSRDVLSRAVSAPLLGKTQAKPPTSLP